VYEKGKKPFVLLLDGVTDVRNFGAIARTAEAAGIDAIVIPQKGAASINGDAIKTSAGALFKITVCKVPSIKQAIEGLQAYGVRVFGASEKAAQFPYSQELNTPIGLVMGNEETGLQSDVIRTCDELIKIPMNGEIGSLNVSVAAGILLYEMVRQRL
jgi:23S rRNA (guanosine2251-2'-O)-methyltransferase